MATATWKSLWHHGSGTRFTSGSYTGSRPATHPSPATSFNANPCMDNWVAKLLKSGSPGWRYDPAFLSFFNASLILLSSCLLLLSLLPFPLTLGIISNVIQFFILAYHVLTNRTNYHHEYNLPTTVFPNNCLVHFNIVSSSLSVGMAVALHRMLPLPSSK